jgi:receptor tyrosine kinase-like orphan receptor 1
MFTLTIKLVLAMSLHFTGSLRFLKVLGNITKEAGESVKLKCEVTGDPPPIKIRWFKNEAPVIEEKGRLVARRYNSQVTTEHSNFELYD